MMLAILKIKKTDLANAETSSMMAMSAGFSSPMSSACCSENSSSGAWKPGTPSSAVRRCQWRSRIPGLRMETMSGTCVANSSMRLRSSTAASRGRPESVLVARSADL